MSPGWLPFRKSDRRKAPRFGVTCDPSYEREGDTWRLRALKVTISNDSDVAHGVDEALIRFDDGRVGLGLRLDPIQTGRIPAHTAVTLNLLASDLAASGQAIRCRVVVYNGKSGRRLDWSSKDVPLFQHGEAPPSV